MADLDITELRWTLQMMIFGGLISEMIAAVARLGIPDLLRDGPRTSEELAAATGTLARPLYGVLRGLAERGLLVEVAPGRFALTAMGALLQTDVPGTCRNGALLFGERWWRDPLNEFMDTLRTGKPAFDRAFGMSVYQYLEQQPAAATLFNAHMADLSTERDAAVLASYDFSQAGTVVDVGGAHGRLLAAILKANPGSRGILFDLPQITDSAAQTMAAAGVADRCEIIGGSFFESVPAGGNTYVLARVIFNWTDEQAVQILTNCRRAMRGRGKLLAIEPSLLSGDPLAWINDMILLVHFGGRDRTEADYRAIFTAAGFALTRVVHTGSPVCILECVPAESPG